MKFAESLPLLDLRAFVATFPAPLGELARPSIVDDAIAGRGDWKVTPEPGLAAAVRDLLRAGGFRPSGRNRPASEYLSRAALDGAFPGINVAVDAGNAISLHGGLPISVIDADLVRGAPRPAIAAAGTSYPFNPSGQSFDAAGLCCLFDDDGVCASPVKDAQRTKTSSTTIRTLCAIWGVTSHAAHVEHTLARYLELLAALGATTRDTWSSLS